MILCDDILLYIYGFLSAKDLKLCSKSHWHRYLEGDQLLKNLYQSNSFLNDLKRQQIITKQKYIAKKSREPSIPSYFLSFREVERHREALYDHLGDINDLIAMLNHLNTKIVRQRHRVSKIINRLQHRRQTSKKQCHTE